MKEYRYEHKGFYVQPHKEHPTCYVVVTTGKGGRIPDILSGMFTTRTLAKYEIDSYLNSKPTKEKTNGEAVQATDEGRGK